MAEPYSLTLVLHGLPTPGRNSRRHWRTVHNENKGWKRSVAFAVGNRKPPRPLEFVYLELTRHSAVRPDPENLHESFKPVVDALRYCGVLAEDKAENFVGDEPHYRWIYAPPRKGHITVFLEDAEAEEKESAASADHARGSLHRENG